MKYFAVPLIAAVGLSACATTKNAPGQSLNDRSALKGEVVVTVSREVPAFGALTSGKMALGALGGAVGGAIAGGMAVSAGNAIVRKNNIEDPANYISLELRSTLENQYGMQGADALKIEKNLSATQLSSAVAPAKYVLDIQTTNWGVMYYSGNWTHYQVNYWVNAKLEDVQTQKVIAQELCKATPDKSDVAPTYGELTDNGAALLKSKLKAAGDECLARFKQDLFPA